MSATDDASLSKPSVSSGFAVRATLAACGLLFGAFAFATAGGSWLPRSVARFEAEAPWIGDAPAAADWPRPQRAGESAPVRGEDAARVIAVSTHEAADATMLAAALSWERTSGAGADRARRVELFQAIEADQFIGPLFRMAPAAECAALLRAHARAARGLAGPAPEGESAPPDAAELVTSLAIEEAARSADPAVLSDALAASLIVERERLARDAAADPHASRVLRERWEARLHRFEGDLDELAAPIEAVQTPLQRELIALVVPSLTRESEPRFAMPSGTLLGAGGPPPAPRVRPIAAVTLALAAIGGALGAALGFALGFAVPRAPASRLRARRSPARSFERGAGLEPARLEAGPRDPGTPAAWLHIVSGGRPRDVARGVMEIVAHGAAAGGRVLVVDGARSLALHRAFEAEGRPGLVDCLNRPLPALGVAQQGGAPRVLLLAYGDRGRRPVWIHLDRLLEEVRPHCDRLVLALSHDAPREIGSVLAGRLMDGWWAAPAGRRAGGSGRLSESLGIAFHRLNLEAGDQPLLELLRGRIRALTPAIPSPTLEVPAPGFEPVSGSVEPAPPVPEVLDSDLQVSERLRFLAWMRRVQAERREELISSKD